PSSDLIRDFSHKDVGLVIRAPWSSGKISIHSRSWVSLDRNQSSIYLAFLLANFRERQACTPTTTRSERFRGYRGQDLRVKQSKLCGTLPLAALQLLGNCTILTSRLGILSRLSSTHGVVF